MLGAVLSMAAFVCRDKRHILKLRQQLRCLQWITRSVILVFSNLKMALQCTCRFQQIAGSQLPHPACGQPGRVTAFSLADSHQQATDSSASSCSVFTLSYHFFVPLESVSFSVLIILCHPFFLSSLLPSSILLFPQFSQPAPISLEASY